MFLYSIPLLLLLLLFYLLLLLSFPLSVSAQVYPWQKNPPVGPNDTGPIIYPWGTVNYIPNKQEPPPPPFMVRMWYIGFILLALFVLAVYVALFVWTRKHFRMAEQAEERRRMKYYEYSYSSDNPLSREVSFSPLSRETSWVN
ncbi:uncharacterized protein TM35_000281810 [Trypanosoma theileri]|uniref:Uncharacterized protein n=1 Tax=Trypanosoma theileri TaxID=67003 RepID=A0A1X0NP45_9TRYP|nr:uncharacterized protein TM35_000281810 [Trypanosoma theileri]ORC86465.1 hypothetical protein TM35_000281810 [Trypanosoma theileri]